MRMSPTEKVLFRQPAPATGAEYAAAPDLSGLAALKTEEISADFLCTEERNHTTDDRDPCQRWEE